MGCIELEGGSIISPKKSLHGGWGRGGCCCRFSPLGQFRACLTGLYWTGLESLFYEDEFRGSLAG